MKQARQALIAVVLLLWSGCADRPRDGVLTVRLPLTACHESGALSESGTCFIKAAVYRGRWDAGPPEAIFDSPCLQYSGDLIAIQELPFTDDELTVQMEGFADEQCTQRVMAAARGGVTLSESGSENAVWFLPAFTQSAFTSFPQLSSSLRELVGLDSCATNSDCTQHSPLGLCNTAESMCQLPSSVFPLNMLGSRAFHTAEVLSDGRIVLIGGLGQEPAEGQFVGSDQPFEVFDPARMTFDLPETLLPVGLRLAGHASVVLSDNRVAFFGGASQMDLQIKEIGPEKAPLFKVELPNGNLLGGANLLSTAFIADLTSGAVSSATLPSPRVFSTATRVPGGVLLAGGTTTIAPSLGYIFSGEMVFCDTGESPTCGTVGQLAAARSSHCARCLTNSVGGDCDEVFLFGGLSGDAGTLEQSALGEVVSKQGSKWSVALVGSEIQGNVHNPTCVSSALGDYLVGGTVSHNLSPAILPSFMAFTANSQAVAVSALTHANGVIGPFRQYAAATPLPDGRVLVTGGLDDEARALQTAYVIDGETIVESIVMSRPRFGHTATLLTTGPMAGAVLVAGGLTTDADGNVDLVPGAELYLP